MLFLQEADGANLYKSFPSFVPVTPTPVIVHHSLPFYNIPSHFPPYPPTSYHSLTFSFIPSHYPSFLLIFNIFLYFQSLLFIIHHFKFSFPSISLIIHHSLLISIILFPIHHFLSLPIIASHFSSLHFNLPSFLPVIHHSLIVSSFPPIFHHCLTF